MQPLFIVLLPRCLCYMIIALIKGHHMNNRLSIIEVLEQSRKTQGLTQDELAKRAGTSRITVGRVEAGFDPKLSTVYEMARALGLELTLVPKALAGEVQAFLRSGGRSLAQPQGASAPPSVVELAGKATSVATATASVTVTPTPTKPRRGLVPLHSVVRASWGPTKSVDTSLSPPPPKPPTSNPHGGTGSNRLTISESAAKALDITTKLSKKMPEGSGK